MTTDITQYAGGLPSAADPATFDARAAALMQWLTVNFAPEIAALAAEIEAALAGSDGVVDALAALQTSPTFSGTVTIGGRLRALAVADATLSSTGHAYQIGPTSGANVALDADGVQARSNGAGATYRINYYGGGVLIGEPGGGAEIAINGKLVGGAVATQSDGEAGVVTDRIMTPFAVEQHMLANALGWGQTWQDVKGARVVGAVYQNTTGRPIQVSVSFINDLAIFAASVDGVTWVAVGAGAGGGSRTNSQAVIPSGHYYRLTGAVVSYWAELR